MNPTAVEPIGPKAWCCRYLSRAHLPDPHSIVTSAFTAEKNLTPISRVEIIRLPNSVRPQTLESAGDCLRVVAEGMSPHDCSFRGSFKDLNDGNTG